MKKLVDVDIKHKFTMGGWKSKPYVFNENEPFVIPLTDLPVSILIEYLGSDDFLALFGMYHAQILKHIENVHELKIKNHPMYQALFELEPKPKPKSLNDYLDEFKCKICKSIHVGGKTSPCGKCCRNYCQNCQEFDSEYDESVDCDLYCNNCLSCGDL